MSVLVPVVLCVLALLDGAFAGFRADVGREARLPDARRNVVAAGWGVGTTVVGLAAIGGACLWAIRDARAAGFDALVTGGARMLWVFAPMAVVTLAAIGLHVLVDDHEVSAAAMTMVLGPITLVRPLVIVAGAVLAAWDDTAVTWLPATAAALVTVGVGPLIGAVRHRGAGRRWQPVP